MLQDQPDVVHRGQRQAGLFVQLELLQPRVIVVRPAIRFRVHELKARRCLGPALRQQ